MTELLTAVQMRAIEQAAIASGEVTGLELMERAGRGVVEAILEWRPELATTAHRAVVLCGPGNNGGDGFVVARLLKERGWEVEVFLYGEEAKLPPDAAENARRWREMGGRTHPWDIEIYDRLKKPALLIDALFGSGLKRPLTEDVLAFFWYLLGHLRRPHTRKYRNLVSIDAPSGLDLDSGKELADGETPLSQLTVTFTMAKVGHHLASAHLACGRLVVKPLGLRREAFLEHGLYNEPVDNRRVQLLDQRLYGKPAPFLKSLVDKRYSWHKYDHGHALILSGGVGKGGAARLAARGALRIGAGLVTLGCPPAALIENAAQVDAIMLRPMADPDALAEALTDNRITALCLGPGFGTGDRLRATVAVALAANRATVLDADALSAFKDAPDALFGQLHPDCVLTPHQGEFGRLFPDLLAKLTAPATKGPAYSKVDATREAAARAGCIVLFKGADTVIAAPDGRCSINSAHYERAAPWLATAGSGDVLAGFITGLLARGLDPIQAAETAAWLHVECARQFGPGLIAEDLPEQLPAVFRDLGL